MPEQLVEPLLAEGRLVRLSLADEPSPNGPPITIYAAHLRNRPPGRAGAWLLQHLRSRLA